MTFELPDTDFQKIADLSVVNEDDHMIVQQALSFSKTGDPDDGSASSWATVASILGVELERVEAINQHQTNILHRAGLYPIREQTPSFSDPELSEKLEANKTLRVREAVINKFAEIIYNENPATQPWDGDAYTFGEASTSHQGKIARRAAEQILRYLTEGDEQ